MLLPLFPTSLSFLLNQMFSPFPYFPYLLAPFWVYFAPIGHHATASLASIFISLVPLSFSHTCSSNLITASIQSSNFSRVMNTPRLNHTTNSWSLVSMSLKSLNVTVSSFPQWPLQRVATLLKLYNLLPLASLSEATLIYTLLENQGPQMRKVPWLAPLQPKNLLKFTCIQTSCLSGRTVLPPFQINSSHLSAHLLDISSSS